MITTLIGDCREKLKELPEKSIQCCVTSTPYWGLRKYLRDGHPDAEKEIGQEATPELFVANIVSVFSEVWRVLRDDGTLWLNIGDSYARAGGWLDNSGLDGVKRGMSGRAVSNVQKNVNGQKLPPGLKSKDLVGVPWMVAFALRRAGWYLRQDIIWNKPSCMPESVTDRCTKSHEYIFLLTKSDKYFYDNEAIKEPVSEAHSNDKRPHGVLRQRFYPESKYVKAGMIELNTSEFPTEERSNTRNKRSVWSVNSTPYSGAHFATFPPDLIKPCILAGTSAKGACPECRSPWERIVNVQKATSKECPKTQAAHLARGGTSKPVGTVGKSGGGRINGFTETKGWQPTCRCGREDVVPCVVLDPFGGSGTTGMVSTELGRDCVLVELNEEYKPLIDQRTNTTPGFQLS